MATITNLDFTKCFNLKTGKFVIEDVTDYAGQGVNLTDMKGVLKIKDPQSSVIYDNTNFGSPDILYTISIDKVDTNTNSITLSGDYSKYFSVSDSIKIDGSTGNDGTYTINSVVVNNSKTDLHFAEAVSSSQPDGHVTNAMIRSGIDVAIPTDANGDYVKGSYEFTLTVEHQGADTTNKTETFDFAYSIPSGSIDITVDCLCSQLTSTDQSDYSNASASSVTTSRTHIVSYRNDQDVRKEETDSTKELKVGDIYTTEYKSSISTEVTWKFSGNDCISFTVNETVYKTVDCDQDLCDLYCCIDSLNKRYLSAKGNNSSLEATYFRQLMLVAKDLSLLRTAIECGQNTDASTIISRILYTANCKEGCQCDEGTIKRVVPVCGSGSGSGGTYVVTGTSGITVEAIVSGSQTTYKTGMEASLKAKLDASYNSVVSSSDSSVNVSTSTSGDTKTYDVKVNNTQQATESEYLAFKVEIKLNNPGSPTGFATGFPKIVESSKRGSKFKVPSLNIATLGANIFGYQSNYFPVTGWDNTGANSNQSPKVWIRVSPDWGSELSMARYSKRRAANIVSIVENDVMTFSIVDFDTGNILPYRSLIPAIKTSYANKLVVDILMVA